jgi:hypothetical protein
MATNLLDADGNLRVRGLKATPTENAAFIASIRKDVEEGDQSWRRSLNVRLGEFSVQYAIRQLTIVLQMSEMGRSFPDDIHMKKAQTNFHVNFESAINLIRNAQEFFSGTLRSKDEVESEIQLRINDLVLNKKKNPEAA